MGLLGVRPTIEENDQTQTGQTDHDNAAAKKHELGTWHFHTVVKEP